MSQWGHTEIWRIALSRAILKKQIRVEFDLLYQSHLTISVELFLKQAGQVS